MNVQQVPASSPPQRDRGNRNSKRKKAKQSVQQQLHCDEPLDFREWAQKRRIDHAAVIMRLIGSENSDLCGTAGQKYERVHSLQAKRRKISVLSNTLIIHIYFGG